MLRTPLAVTIALAATLPAQTTHDLRSMARPGKTFAFVHDMRQSQKVVGRAEPPIEMRIERTFSLTIREIADDGDFVATIDITRVRGAMVLPLVGERTFDSDDERTRDDPTVVSGLGPEVARMLTSLEHRYTVRVDGYGDVRAVQLEAGGAGHATARRWHERSLAHLVGSAFGELPTQPVALGQDWAFTRESPGERLPLQQKGRMSLVALDDDRIVMQLAGALEGRARKGDEPTIDCKVENGVMTGRQVVSRRTGLIRTSTVDASAELVMQSPGGELTTRLTVRTSLRQVEAPQRDGARPDPDRRG